MRTKKILINTKEYEYQVKKDGDKISIFIEGNEYKYNQGALDRIPAVKLSESTDIWVGENYYRTQKANLVGHSQGMGAGSLKSPMPGKIFKIILSAGSKVKAGETILILEAMKMEHAIKSPIDGVVESIEFAEGDIVDGGVNLATVEETSL